MLANWNELIGSDHGGECGQVVCEVSQPKSAAELKLWRSVAHIPDDFCSRV